MAFKIGITSLPSALRYCCTVLELNLQDPSKHIEIENFHANSCHPLLLIGCEQRAAERRAKQCWFRLTVRQPRWIVSNGQEGGNSDRYKGAVVSRGGGQSTATASATATIATVIAIATILACRLRGIKTWLSLPGVGADLYF